VLHYANFSGLRQYLGGGRSVSDLREMPFVEALGAVEDLVGEFRVATGRAVHEDLPVGSGAAGTVGGFHRFFERVSSGRFRTLFDVPEGRPVEVLFAGAAAVAGVLSSGGRDWLYRMAVAFGERGFGGPGPHVRWLAPARLVQVLHWADARAGGPIGSGQTLSRLRGMEPETAVRHLTDLARRFEQDEQFAPERARGQTVWSEPGQRPDPETVLDDLEAWVADMMDISVEAYYELPEYGVTPVQMMGYLRTISMEPVGLDVPGLGADVVPLHRVGTADLVDLVHLVDLLECLPDGEMRAAAEGAGLAPSMGPFLLRLANILRLGPGQFPLLRVVRGPLLNSLRGGQGPQTWLADVFLPFLADQGIDTEALYGGSESEVLFVRRLLERLHGLGLNIDELPGLGERAQSQLMTSGTVEPGAYGDLTPEQRRVMWKSFTDGEAPDGEFVRTWRAGQLGMSPERYDALVEQPWFDAYWLRQLGESLGVGEDLSVLVRLAERLEAMPWGLVELVDATPGTTPQALVDWVLGEPSTVQRMLGSGVLRWPPILGTDGESNRRRNLHAKVSKQVGRAVLTSGRGAAGRLAAQLSREARDNGEHWIGTEAQRLARTSGGADRFLNSGSGSGSASGSGSGSGSGAASGPSRTRPDATSTTDDVAATTNDALSQRSDDALSQQFDDAPSQRYVDEVNRYAHHWGLDAEQAATLLAHVQELGHFPEAVVGLTQALGVGPNQVFVLAGRLGVEPEHLVMVSDELSELLGRFSPSEQASRGADALRQYLEEAGFRAQDLGWFVGSRVQLRLQDLLGFRRFVGECGFALEDLRSGEADADVLVRGWLRERRLAAAAAGVAFGEHRARAEALVSDAGRAPTLRAAAQRLREASEALLFLRDSDLALLFPQDIATLYQERRGAGLQDNEGWEVPEGWVESMRSQFDVLGLRTAEDWAAFARLIEACPGLFATGSRPGQGQEGSGSQTVPDWGLGSARYPSLDQFLRSVLRLDLAALRDEPLWAGVANRLFAEMAKLSELPGVRSDPRALEDLGERLAGEVVGGIVRPGLQEWMDSQDEHTVSRWMSYELAGRPLGPVVRAWAQANAARDYASLRGMNNEVTRVFVERPLPVGVDVTAVMKLARDWELDAEQAVTLVAHVQELGRFPAEVVGLTQALRVGPNQVFVLAGRLGVEPEHLVMVSDELSELLGRFSPSEQASRGADALRRRLEEAGFVPQDLGWFAGSGVQLRAQDLVGFRRFVLENRFTLEGLRSGAVDAGVLVRGWLEARRGAAAAVVAFGEHRARAEALVSDAGRAPTLRAAAQRLGVDAAHLALLFPQDIATLYGERWRAGLQDNAGWEVPERWVEFMRSQFDVLGLRTAEDWAAFARLIEACPELFATGQGQGQGGSGSQTVPDLGLGSARYLPLDQFVRSFRIDMAALSGEPVWAGVMNRLFVEMAEWPGLRSDPRALRDLQSRLDTEVNDNLQPEAREWLGSQDERTVWRWLGYELAARPWGEVVRAWALAYAERQGALDDSGPYTDSAPRVRAALDGLDVLPDFSEHDAEAGQLPSHASVQSAPLLEPESESLLGSELSGPPPAYPGPVRVPASAGVRDWAVRVWGVEGARVEGFSAHEIVALEALRQRLGVRQMENLLSVVAGMGEVPSVADLVGAAGVLGLRDVKDLYRVLKRFPVRLDELHRLAGQRELADVFRPLNGAWALVRDRVVERVASRLRDLVQNGSQEPVGAGPHSGVDAVTGSQEPGLSRGSGPIDGTGLSSESGQVSVAEAGGSSSVPSQHVRSAGDADVEQVLSGLAG
ncbi:hypothetical protein ABZ826_38775, partial [Streptomyces sp. NPDC047515]